MLSSNRKTWRLWEFAASCRFAGNLLGAICKKWFIRISWPF